MPTKPKISEADVARQVIDYLRAKGWRYLRMQRIVSRAGGRFVATGEIGMPDALFLRYVAGGKRILWVEFKSPNDRRKCVPWKHTPDGHYCTVCAQKNWREKEIWAGAAVWVISDFDYFKSLYEETRFL